VSGENKDPECMPQNIPRSLCYINTCAQMITTDEFVKNSLEFYWGVSNIEKCVT